MPLHDSIYYQAQRLYIDDVPAADIAREMGTPVYVYSLKRALDNLRRIRDAYSGVHLHVHYSAKANANLTILRTLIEAGAGIDAVSAGEIHRALTAGAKPENIVFAGVGKSPEEIRYAVEQGVGWFNVENVAELQYINDFAAELGRNSVQVALRLNPEVTANTHPYIATGHGGAKFGLTAEVIQQVLANHRAYPNLFFAGLHIHIGSQLGDTRGTVEAIEKAVELITPHPTIRTLNIGGGLPVAYQDSQILPSFTEFAADVTPLLKDYTVLLEPGRSIIADAGVLLTKILYVKQQAGQTLYITDASMTELIRPALYKAIHDIVPVNLQADARTMPVQIVGPVCETSDVLGRDVPLPELQPGDLLAILTAGAYGMVMASNYNARPRPAEVVVNPAGNDWSIARRRETWDDLLRHEL
jgi:diaminopimelate decarboxylase